MKSVTTTKTHIETAREIIALDNADQSEIEKIHAKRAQLECDYSAVDDDAVTPTEIIAKQDAIQLEIGRLGRQEAIFQKRAKSRLPTLHDALQCGKDNHRDAEFKFRDERLQLANDTISSRSDDIQNIKDLLMAIVWLRDTSQRNLTDALESLLDGKEYFDWSDTVDAAKRLGLYREEPERPEELAQATAIIERELGDGWHIQDQDWLDEKLNRSDDTPEAYDVGLQHHGDDNGERTQYVGMSNRSSH